MKKNKSNNGKFKKSHRINAGIIFFGVILAYLIIIVIINSKSSRIIGYQVKKGTLSENRIYQGIALREELPVLSPVTGYVSLFYKEGERVAFNNQVYAIDETGKISDLIVKDPVKETTLSSDDLESLRQDIMVFSKQFKDNNFEDATIFERTVNDELSRYENRELFLSIDAINSMHINDVINFYRAPGAGIIGYYLDGYEMATPESLTKADFDKENYECKYITNDTLVEANSFVYKYTNDENWKLCLYIPTEEMSKIVEDEYLKVKFLKTDTSSYGKVHIVNNFEDGSVISLTFTNSMVTFSKNRFVDIELLLEEDTGLKVPNSAIADNNFFLIDKDFVFTNGSSNTLGVNKQVVSQSGDVFTRFTEVTVYDETENEYYVSMNGLDVGDVLYYVETVENQSIDHPLTFTVGKQGTLIGVYNINKGFAEFKQINILHSNDEYSIIKSNTPSGLRAYDYIALDAAVVTDKAFVYD